MAKLLLLETATEVCSAALSADGDVIAFREQKEGFRHSELLTLFIGELLKDTGLTGQQLEGVCVSRGPGSYTGLRIGVSVAKGFCYALDIPLLSVSTLECLAGYVSRNYAQLTGPEDGKSLLCPMLDARRMEIYYALYDRNGKQLTGISAEIIGENSFSEEMNHAQLIFFGNGAEKCKELFAGKNALFIPEMDASARFMSFLAEDHFRNQNFENVAYFEPFYLKEFIATIPKNKIIHNEGKGVEL